MNMKEELKADAAAIRKNNIEIKRLQKNGEYAGFLQCARISLRKNWELHKQMMNWMPLYKMYVK